MKRLTIIILLFAAFNSMAQNDTTVTFTYDTIPYHIEVDTVLFESELIVIDTMGLSQEFNEDFKLLPWYVRDSININIQKFAKRHVQKGFKKYGTSNVIRFYRYRDIRYIRVPEKIKTKVKY